MPQITRTHDVIPVPAQPFREPVLTAERIDHRSDFVPIIEIYRLPPLPIPSLADFRPFAGLCFEIELERHVPQKPVKVWSDLACIHARFAFLKFQSPEQSHHQEPPFKPFN